MIHRNLRRQTSTNWTRVIFSANPSQMKNCYGLSVINLARTKGNLKSTVKIHRRRNSSGVRRCIISKVSSTSRNYLCTYKNNILGVERNSGVSVTSVTAKSSMTSAQAVRLLSAKVRQFTLQGKIRWIYLRTSRMQPSRSKN